MCLVLILRLVFRNTSHDIILSVSYVARCLCPVGPPMMYTYEGNEMALCLGRSDTSRLVNGDLLSESEKFAALLSESSMSTYYKMFKETHECVCVQVNNNWFVLV